MSQYTDQEKLAYYKKLARSKSIVPYGNKFPKKQYQARYQKIRRPQRKQIAMDKTTGIIQTSKNVGKAIGSSFGPLGSMAGSALGGLVGQGIKYFTGRGAYTVKENVLISEEGGEMPPIINRERDDGAVIIRRSEYIGDITSSSVAGAFKVQSFFINPGLQTTFQWLSQVAPNFEEWEPEGMYFEYRSMSGDALTSTNTALGQVIMSAEYNSTHPPFANKQEMENYENGISIKPSESCRFFVECARNKTVLSQLYTRAGAVPSGDDGRFYDLANFQIATNGLQGTNVNVGELWVCYQIALRKPKLFGAIGLDNSYSAISGTGATDALPMGTAWDTPGPDDTLLVTFTSTTMTFPAVSVPQAYLMYVGWFGTNPAVWVNPAPTGSNGVTVTIIRRAPVNATVSTNCCALYSVAIASTVAFSGLPTITWGTAGSIPTTNCSMVSYIVQIPNIALNI